MTITTAQPQTLSTAVEKVTTAGNYFVSNYPPFSQWSPQQVGEVLVLRVAHGAIEEGHIELAVGHGLDVSVLAIDCDRPQADVGGGIDGEDELVRIEHRAA